MLRQSLALVFLSLATFSLQAKTTLPNKNVTPNDTKTNVIKTKTAKTTHQKPSVTKAKIAQNFHTCFKEAWNLQWQNYCVTEATKSYKRLIPKSQQTPFKNQVKSCTTKFGDVTKLDSNHSWQVYECEMHAAEKFAR